MKLSYSEYFPWGDPTNFRQKVLDGWKIHSIREDPLDRWPPSTGIIHHVVNNRQTNEECFLETPCTGVQRVEILRPGLVPYRAIWRDVIGDAVLVLVDNTQLNADEVEELARNDGFTGLPDFFEWFADDFIGKIIHWTDKRYGRIPPPDLKFQTLKLKGVKIYGQTNERHGH